MPSRRAAAERLPRKASSSAVIMRLAVSHSAVASLPVPVRGVYVMYQVYLVSNTCASPVHR